MRHAVTGLLLATLGTLAPGALGAQLNYFGQNKVQFKDFAWQVLRGEHVDVYFYPEEDQVARVALAYDEESFHVLEPNSGPPPPRRIPLIIYASHTDFEQTNVLPFLPPEGILGVTESLRSRVMIPFQGDYAEFRHTVRHELVHAFQLSVSVEAFERHPRGSRPAIPLWWTEGLAEHWSAGQDSRDEMILRELTISGVLPTLTQLNYIIGGVVYPLGGPDEGTATVKAAGGAVHDLDLGADNALDEAIAPLLAIARSLRTTAERDALAVYVIRKIVGSR